MVRGIFIGIKRTLEALGILEKSKLVQVGEGHLFPFLNFPIQGGKGLLSCIVRPHALEPKGSALKLR
jgi:hypothetical protein